MTIMAMDTRTILKLVTCQYSVKQIIYHDNNIFNYINNCLKIQNI